MVAALSAVVFSAGFVDSAPALAGWLDAGHRISAAVFPATAERRIKRSIRYDHPGSIWSSGGILRRGAPEAEVIYQGLNSDTAPIEDMVRRLQPDLIISSHWMRRLSGRLLSLARLGGVNVHPALLPYYRGPDPLNGMIMAGDLRKAGGVTLHQMTERFDEGPIIAQIPLRECHWTDSLQMRRALGSAQYQLVRNDLHRWLSGTITTCRQTGGNWHDKSVRSSRIEATWPAERLLPISRLLLQNSRRLRALSTPTGPIPLPQVLRVIGPPTGAPIATGRKWLEFDCKDARIRAIGRRRISIALERQRIKRTLRRSLPLEGLESSTDAGP